MFSESLNICSCEDRRFNILKMQYCQFLENEDVTSSWTLFQCNIKIQRIHDTGCISHFQGSTYRLNPWDLLARALTTYHFTSMIHKCALHTMSAQCEVFSSMLLLNNSLLFKPTTWLGRISGALLLVLSFFEPCLNGPWVDKISNIFLLIHSNVT